MKSTDNLNLAQLRALHEWAGNAVRDVPWERSPEEIARDVALRDAFPALADRLEAAERERGALEEAFACSEGIMPDGELGPTKHNMAAWLAARDARMKALGAAEALTRMANEECSTVFLGDLPHVTKNDLLEEAARLRREAESSS